MSRLKVKVCGMKEAANVEQLIKCYPDYLGYIFYKRSLRFVGENPDPAIFNMVPESITRTAVFVNEQYDRMVDILSKYNIRAVQLHGMESPGNCNQLRISGFVVIKVIPGDQVTNIELISQYEPVVDYLLFDTPVRTYGGSGRKFDWTLISKLNTDRPFFLSGGISNEDVEEIKKIDHRSFNAVDINSRFEIEPGIKDVEKVKEFIKRVKDE